MEERIPKMRLLLQLDCTCTLTFKGHSKFLFKTFKFFWCLLYENPQNSCVAEECMLLQTSNPQKKNQTPTI